MATLIICPACDTRYETAAVFPPEGRKVRCSKCGHVWQAVAVTLPPQAGAAPAAKPAAAPQATPKPQPKPAPAPAAPAAPQPSVAAQPTTPMQPAPARPGSLSPGLTGFTGLQKPQPSAMPKPPPPPPPPQASGDAEFGESEAAAEAPTYNSEAWTAGEDAPAAEKKGGLFGRFTAKKPAAPAAPPVPPPGMLDPTLSDAFKADAGDAAIQPDGDASLGEASLGDASLGEADLGVPPPRKKSSKGRFSPVGIGWAALAAVVALVLGTLLFAPSTVVSVVPGAARLYALFGMPVGAHGLAFQGVRYGWTNEGGQMVLEVQGDVVNNSGSKVEVPTVIIALRDESGEEISEWTTEVTETQLDGGESTAFLRQIPSPPSNVRSVKVRFAKAAD